MSDKGATGGDSAIVHIEPRRRYDLIDTTESGPEDAGAKGRERRLSYQTSVSEEKDGGTAISTEAVYNFETVLRKEALYEDSCKGQINSQPTARTLWSRLSHQTSASEEEDGGTVISTEGVYNFETVLRTEVLYEDACKGQINRQPTTRTLWSVSEDNGTAEGTVEDTIYSTDAVYNFDAYLRNEALTTVVQPVFDSGVVRDLRALLEFIEIATTPSFEEQYNQDA